MGDDNYGVQQDLSVGDSCLVNSVTTWKLNYFDCVKCQGDFEIAAKQGVISGKTHKRR